VVGVGACCCFERGVAPVNARRHEQQQARITLSAHHLELGVAGAYVAVGLQQHWN